METKTKSKTNTNTKDPNKYSESDQTVTWEQSF